MGADTGPPDAGSGRRGELPAARAVRHGPDGVGGPRGHVRAAPARVAPPARAPARRRERGDRHGGGLRGLEPLGLSAVLRVRLPPRRRRARARADAARGRAGGRARGGAVRRDRARVRRGRRPVRRVDPGRAGHPGAVRGGRVVLGAGDTRPAGPSPPLPPGHAAVPGVPGRGRPPVVRPAPAGGGLRLRGRRPARARGGEVRGDRGGVAGDGGAALRTRGAAVGGDAVAVRDAPRATARPKDGPPSPPAP